MLMNGAGKNRVEITSLMTVIDGAFWVGRAW